MNEQEKEDFMRTDSAKVITMPGGEEVGVTITNWHWLSLEWMAESMNTPITKVIDAVRNHEDYTDLDRGIQEFIEGFIERCEKEGMLG